MNLKTTFGLVCLVLSAFWACSPQGGQEHSTEADSPETVQPPQLTGEEISYEADSITMKGYLAYDASQTGPRPGILVVHEWWGHNDYARKRADMLAEMGYVALAVDMYGDGKTAEHPDDAGKFAMEVFSNLEGGTARFQKAYETLKANPQVDGANIAAIGYCFGGTVVINMANLGMDLKGVAGFHAGLSLPVQPVAGEVKAKVLVCNGAADPMITAEDVTAFEEAMTGAGVDYTYIDYPEVVHAFTNPGATALGEQFELPLAYNAEADEASWNELKSFLEEIF